VYERFGQRLSSDGYVVHAFVGMAADDQVNAIAWLAVDAPKPVVVVGVDSGALEALSADADLPGVLAGLVLAGIPSGRTPAMTEWDDELDTRSACPVHRARLESEVIRGALASTTIPDQLMLAARRATPSVPVLVLHGSADVVASVSGARRWATRLPTARLVVVDEGRHDVLNDVSHRSVAAEIVQFLERVRGSDRATPILRVEVG
jgi:pimeloyl-ACP methyl ester carboxylesterase